MELKDEIVPLDLTQNRIRQIQDPSPTEVDPEESQLTGSRVIDESEPDFIQDMLNKMDVELSKEQEERVKQLLHENREVFSTSEFDLGRTNLVQHRIDTGVNRPIPASTFACRANMRSSSRLDRLLYVPRTKTKTLGPRGFYYASSAVWNSLPVNLRDPGLSLHSFRTKLKSHFFIVD